MAYKILRRINALEYTILVASNSIDLLWLLPSQELKLIQSFSEVKNETYKNKISEALQGDRIIILFAQLAMMQFSFDSYLQ